MQIVKQPIYLHLPGTTCDGFTMPDESINYVNFTSAGMEIEIYHIFDEMQRLKTNIAWLSGATKMGKTTSLKHIYQKLGSTTNLAFLDAVNDDLSIINISQNYILIDNLYLLEKTNQYKLINALEKWQENQIKDCYCLIAWPSNTVFTEAQKLIPLNVTFELGQLKSIDLTSYQYSDNILLKLMSIHPNCFEGLQLLESGQLTLKGFFDRYSHQYQSAIKLYNSYNILTKDMLYEEIKSSMVDVPSGSVIIGSPDSEIGRWLDEGPQQQKQVSSFYINTIPITNRQYLNYIRLNPQLDFPPFIWDNRFNHPEQPVVGISWDNASIFASWLDFQLPTELQWEYACRAKSMDARYGKLDEIANYYENSNLKLQTVGSKLPNKFGIYDMLGNTWEWVTDKYAPYGKKPSNANSHILKGGSWSDMPRTCRAATRLNQHPGPRIANQGFRVVNNKE